LNRPTFSLSPHFLVTISHTHSLSLFFLAPRLSLDGAAAARPVAGTTVGPWRLLAEGVAGVAGNAHGGYPTEGVAGAEAVP